MAMNEWEPAFPQSDVHVEYQVRDSESVPIDIGRGMSLRDWFAGQAFQSLIPAQMTEAAFKVTFGDAAQMPEIVAAWAYRFADAMLAERAKGK